MWNPIVDEYWYRKEYFDFLSKTAGQYRRKVPRYHRVCYSVAIADYDISEICITLFIYCRFGKLEDVIRVWSNPKYIEALERLNANDYTDILIGAIRKRDIQIFEYLIKNIPSIRQFLALPLSSLREDNLKPYLVIALCLLDELQFAALIERNWSKVNLLCNYELIRFAATLSDKASSKFPLVVKTAVRVNLALAIRAVEMLAKGSAKLPASLIISVFQFYYDERAYEWLPVTNAIGEHAPAHMPVYSDLLVRAYPIRLLAPTTAQPIESESNDELVTGGSAAIVNGVAGYSASIAARI